MDDGDFGLVLWATDIPALCRFLEVVGGLAVEARHPGFASLRLNGSRIEIHDDEAARTHPWYQALAREGVARGIGTELRLRVQDVSVAFAKALQLGGLAIQPPAEIDGSCECQVMGPDGYVMSLWQPLR